MVRLVLILIFCTLTAVAFSAEKEALLSIVPVSDDFFDNALDGNNPDLAGQSNVVTVIGLLNIPSFSIKSVTNVALYDQTGSLIPLTIDKSSKYSEFDETEINSVRIAFTIPEHVLSRGAPRLIWGENVSVNNREVEKISVYRGDKNRYRTFNWEKQPQGTIKNENFATLEVIVDDYADSYYLWYLLPMFLIIGLLLVKKRALR